MSALSVECREIHFHDGAAVRVDVEITQVGAEADGGAVDPAGDEPGVKDLGGGGRVIAHHMPIVESGVEDTPVLREGKPIRGEVAENRGGTVAGVERPDLATRGDVEKAIGVVGNQVNIGSRAGDSNLLLSKTN